MAASIFRLVMSELPYLLIVDGSKVVRASLAAKLKGSFNIREESNGESAWQTLILDSSIVATIAAQSLAKLDGLALLDKVRSSKLNRLKTMPFFLMASDAMSDDLRHQAMGRGASGFVAKNACAAESARMLHDLRRHVSAGILQDAVAIRCSTGVPDSKAGQGRLVCGKESCGSSDFHQSASLNVFGDDSAGALDAEFSPQPRADIEACLDRLLATPTRGQGVGVLVFCMDNHAALTAQFGQSMTQRIEAKFEQLLVGKLRSGDCMTRVDINRLVVVATDTTLALCAAFAERICKRLAEATISVSGQPVSMTFSAGVAGYPEKDGSGLSGRKLLALAERRVEAALRGGGNRVVRQSEDTEDHQREVLRQFGQLLSGVEASSLAPHFGQLGLLILPLLKEIDCSFRFELPIQKMESMLAERARGEPAVG